MQKSETVPLSYAFHKAQFKTDLRLKHKTWILKLLLKTQGESLLTLVLAMLLAITSKTQVMKAKI